jgi:hypothetical protein
MKLIHIAYELKSHIPFTSFGAFTGVIIVVVINICNVPASVSKLLFCIFHPLHVLLSAIATTGMIRLHSKNKLKICLVGYIGAIGIATLSDVIFPYLGGVLLKVSMELHIGFIKEWWIVNPLAFMGIMIGYFRPLTKIPHMGHVLLSTWASLFTLTAFGVAEWAKFFHFVFLILFLAVWIPCCLSDIVFPLIFVSKEG